MAPSSLKGKQICFTGELNSMKRKEASTKAEAKGAIVKKTAVKTLDILVVGEGAGEKADKAPPSADIWTEDAFLDALKGKGGGGSSKKESPKKAKKGSKRKQESSSDEDDDDESSEELPKKKAKKTSTKKPAKKSKKKESSSSEESESESEESDEESGGGAEPPKSLKGKILCISGTLSSMKRAEAQKLAKKAGAEVKPGMSKAVNVLVAGEGAGSKVDQASDKCAVITEKQFKKLLK